MPTDRQKFRFMDLELWHDSMKVAQRLFDLAEGLEAKKLHQLAEQLRGAGLSLIAPCFFSLLFARNALRSALCAWPSAIICG